MDIFGVDKLYDCINTAEACRQELNKYIKITQYLSYQLIEEQNQVMNSKLLLDMINELL